MCAIVTNNAYVANIRVGDRKPTRVVDNFREMSKFVHFFMSRMLNLEKIVCEQTVRGTTRV
jgi:hypothetical protein